MDTYPPYSPPQNADLPASANTPEKLAGHVRDQFVNRYTGPTYDLYSHHVKQWFSYCLAQSFHPLAARRADIEAYSQYCRDTKNHSSSTISSMISTLNTMYELALDDDIVYKNPCRLARRPKVIVDQNRVPTLSRIDTTKLISTAQSVSTRHGALFQLLLVLALRATESANVRISDTQHHQDGHRVLKLVGKGGKPATLPIPVSVGRILDLAIQDREPNCFLIYRLSDPNSTAAPLHRSSISGMIRTVVKHADISLDKPITPHTLRHAAITHALSAGVDLADAQDFARHADPKTTQRYNRRRGKLDRHGAHTLARWLSSN